MTAATTDDLTIDDENNQVRVITTGGDIVSFRDHGTDYSAAWDDFTDTIAGLEQDQIVQLIAEDLIAAEHNPEYHGPTALPVGTYA